ncbi:hypothetical protein [Rhodococcus opacus]|uniref:hypothetical protein n=1 Tax=Rhodococcus opacus TaxID=37919 RepID=UPI0029538ADF|nr:hypothetical protein [Rhodococcus opacus]MDV7089157.1 hypothetical protein [Rhodococcus opacus]
MSADPRWTPECAAFPFAVLAITLLARPFCPRLTAGGAYPFGITVLVAAQPFGFFVFAYGRYPVLERTRRTAVVTGARDCQELQTNSDNDPDPS